MPTGFSKVLAVTEHGRQLSTQEVLRRGLVTPYPGWPDWLPHQEGELPLGPNLFLDAGRQYLAYAWGYRSPVSNVAVASFGVGTGTVPPITQDTALQAPVAFASGLFTKPVDNVTYPNPFIAQVNYTLAAADCNGYLISEVGFFSGDGTLLIRLVRTGLNKQSSIAFSCGHSVRF
jgi:hypothetical protein